jgi:hypothetical protein
LTSPIPRSKKKAKAHLSPWKKKGARDQSHPV